MRRHIVVLLRARRLAGKAFVFKRMYQIKDFRQVTRLATGIWNSKGETRSRGPSTKDTKDTWPSGPGAESISKTVNFHKGD